MFPRCQWPGGCTTVLREGNKTGICGAHEKQMARQRMGGEENLARRVEYADREFAAQIARQIGAVEVERVVNATDFFYGTSTEAVHDGLSFARQVAVYLLHSDLHLSFEAVSRYLKADFNSVKRAHYKIRTMADSSPDVRRNLENIRAQFRGPA